jgi:hypothetical protein
MRLRAKTDTNQPAIVRQLRQYPGISVFDTHQLGKGFADICVGYRGINHLFEIKEEKGKLTLDEYDFQLKWRGTCYTVYNAREILNHIKYPL